MLYNTPNHLLLVARLSFLGYSWDFGVRVLWQGLVERVLKYLLIEDIWKVRFVSCWMCTGGLQIN